MRMSRFASSSHTGSVGQFSGYLQRLLNRFRRDSASEALVDFVEVHPCPKALQYVRYGKPRAADRWFPAEPLRVRDDPTIVLVRSGRHVDLTFSYS
jgi:hypothetical protein